MQMTALREPHPAARPVTRVAHNYTQGFFRMVSWVTLPLKLASLPSILLRLTRN